MNDIRNEFRRTLQEYSDLEGMHIAPGVLEETITKSTENELHMFLAEDKGLRRYAKDYIDFCSITVGILSIFGSMSASELIKKHYK
jgi:hypothetical protein